MNGKQEGVGAYYDENKEVRYGKWTNGKRVKWIKKQEFINEKSKSETYFTNLYK